MNTANLQVDIWLDIVEFPTTTTLNTDDYTDGYKRDIVIIHDMC